jgi:collagenase-like PrtC family protease
MRCYHARSHDLTKDTCQFVCGQDPDGLAADTIDGVGVLTINGTQTLSNGYLVLLQELAALRRMGVTHFRLSPQDVDMVAVARTYRAVLDGTVSLHEAAEELRGLTGEVPWQNGFLHGREGLAWVERELTPA